MNNIFIGNVEFQGNTTKINTDNLIIKDYIVGINSDPISGNDMGIIMPIHPSDVINPQYTGVVVSGTSNTVEVTQSIDPGWIVEIVETGERRSVLSVLGFILTVDPWVTIPTAINTYRLYQNTHIGMIFKPSDQKFYISYTNQDNLSGIVPLSDPITFNSGTTSRSSSFNLIDNCIKFILLLLPFCYFVYFNF